MSDLKNKNKGFINTIINGEPVKLKKHVNNNYLSVILYHESPSVEYLESKYIKYHSGDRIFFVNKLNLN